MATFDQRQADAVAARSPPAEPSPRCGCSGERRTYAERADARRPGTACRGLPEPAAVASDTRSPAAPTGCQLVDSPSQVTLTHPWV